VTWNVALPLAAAGSGAAWARLAARRGNVRAAFAVRALLGGAAAFGLSVAAYDALALAGVAIRWETVARGGSASLLAALAIGLVEEGAKLAGILLVLDRRGRPGAVAAAAVGVAAGFSALEALVVLGAEASVVALARAALGPVAHALLAAPLALGIVAWRGRPGRRALALPVALAAAAALHGGSDLALAVPGIGPYGYAAALSAPALVLFARKRKGPLGWRTLSTHRGRPLLGSPAGGRSCV
jgi:RsiW-degrading membrane proteinase PrsW (M82 family)